MPNWSRSLTTAAASRPSSAGDEIVRIHLLDETSLRLREALIRNALLLHALS